MHRARQHIVDEALPLRHSLLGRLRSASLRLSHRVAAHLVAVDERALALLAFLDRAHRRLRLRDLGVLQHDRRPHLPDVRVIDLGKLVHVAKDSGALHHRSVLIEHLRLL